jgi:Cu2+-exporting ATPase
LAALGYLTPLIAAAAMAGSSLIVTLNALRVRRGSPAKAAARSGAARLNILETAT